MDIHTSHLVAPVRLVLIHIFIAFLWLNAFPTSTDLDFLDISLESIYFISMFTAYIYGRYLGIKYLNLGFSLLSSGLFIDVLDEFTIESALWSTLFQGIIEISGAVIIAFAIFKTHHQLMAELNQSQKTTKLHRHLALHDALTGIPNRRLLNDKLELAIQTAKAEQHQIAVLYIDLNDFKFFNDCYGHDFGDVLLQQLTLRIGNSIRCRDTIARVGGDEFVIVLTHIATSDQLSYALDKVYDMLVEPFEINGNTISAKTSIGIARYPHDAQTVEGLLKKADTAMYESKLQKSVIDVV